MKMMWKVLLLTVLASACLAEEDQKTWVIGGIPKNLSNPVFSCPKTGAERAAAQLGSVTLLWEAPAQEDPVAQAAILEALVEKGVDGLLVSCADSDLLRPSIDKAVEHGIPVITFDSDSPNSKRTAFYGVDDEKLGRRLGEEMARLLNDQGRVAVLSGSRGARNLQLRAKGLQDALANSAGMAIIGTYYCEDDVAKSVQIIQDVTAKDTPDGWVLLGGWPLFAEDGLTAIPPGKIKVVAVDPLPQCWKWIEDNRVQVCLGQKVFGWGEEGVRLVMRAIRREPLPSFVDSGFDVVTPETLVDYKKVWATMSGQP